MKLDVTPAQLKAIKDITDTISATIGVLDEEYNKICEHQVKMVDKMLKRNNLPPRDFK